MGSPSTVKLYPLSDCYELLAADNEEGSATLVYPILVKMSTHISKRRKFVADGVFRAELNDFLTRELAEEGYSGCDVRETPSRAGIEVSAGSKSSLEA